jgi:hypothetical protein
VLLLLRPLDRGEWARLSPLLPGRLKTLVGVTAGD